MPPKKRFTAAEFPETYPEHEVAENEVLMVFTHDSGAEYFHDWWREEGAVLFQAWLDKQPKEGDV
jgi:hypothetical protein